MSGLNTVIGTREVGTLRGDDFHPTPPCATEALCDVERFDGPVWEPACGDGAISRILEARGYEVISTDLVDRGYGQGRIDFLMEQSALAPNIVTNPPFKDSDEFARHALRLADRKVAFLLRLVWLAGKSRGEMFRQAPLARVWVFSGRLPRWHRGGYEGPKSSSAIDFAWFVFERGHRGAPALGWLP